MLYVLRLSTGDCMIVEARDESLAQELGVAYGLEEGESIVSVRPLPRFAARYPPNDSGSLDVNSWDDATLDDILAHEYPMLDEAFRQANSLPLMETTSVTPDSLRQLKGAHEKNLEIIRKGLRLELQRFTPETSEKEKASRT